jgi:hypothetical protein
MAAGSPSEAASWLVYLVGVTFVGASFVDRSFTDDSFTDDSLEDSWPSVILSDSAGLA